MPIQRRFNKPTKAGGVLLLREGKVVRTLLCLTLFAQVSVQCQVRQEAAPQPSCTKCSWETCLLTGRRYLTSLIVSCMCLSFPFRVTSKGGWLHRGHCLWEWRCWRGRCGFVFSTAQPCCCAQGCTQVVYSTEGVWAVSCKTTSVTWPVTRQCICVMLPADAQAATQLSGQQVCNNTKHAIF